MTKEVKEKKKRSVVTILSNIAMAIGLALTAYYLYTFITTQINLPPGVCPFDQARPFAYAAGGFLAVALALSFFEPKKERKKKKDKKDQ